MDFPSVITITDGTCSAELLPFGATLRTLSVPDRTGTLTDVTLGYDSLAPYRDLGGCLGGTIGRCANRTAGARFTLHGREYHLTPNKGTFHAHGGNVGYHKREWQVIRQTPDSVTFALDDPAGQEGYPGSLHVEISFTLKDGALSLDYAAAAGDQDTPVNLTNHAYFNLAGQDGGSVADHKLTVRAEGYTVTDEASIPTGEIAPVAGTPLDLRQPVILGERWDDPFLKPFGGYDNNLVLTGGEGPDAALYCPRTGICMEMETTMEGVQVYTANSLSERPGKAGAVYGPHQGVCLETQHFPDAVNHPNFPTSVLAAGQTFRSRTVYRFSVR